MQHERNGERAFRPFAALQIERILRRVVAEVATTRGGHVTGHPVVLRPRVEHACLGLGLHAHRQKRFEPARLPVEQADLDDVELQQILRVVQDVAFEEIDPLLDRHVGQFGRRQIGEFLSGLVDGREFLLLEDGVRDVPYRGDRDGWDVGVGAGRSLQMKISVVGGLQRGGRRAARGDRHVERAGFRAHSFRAVERLEEVEAAQIGLAAPGCEETVGPDDRVVSADEGDAVWKVFQDASGVALPGQAVLRRGWDWIRHQRLSAHRSPVGSLPRQYKIR